MTKSCDFQGCTNLYRTNGLCQAHHFQRLAGRPLTPIRPKATLYTGCKTEGCTGQHYAKGLCQKDYARGRRTGEITSNPNGNYLALSDDDIRAIRSAYAVPKENRPTHKQLAEAYGVSSGTIQRIVTRKAWDHVA